MECERKVVRSEEKAYIGLWRQMMIRYFDPAERIREKQRARDRDDLDLASGRVSAGELQQRNSFAAGLDLVNAEIHVPNPNAW